MKKVLSILMVAMMGLALCTTVACNNGGNSTNNTENNGGDTTIVNDVWVDLGLPSGTKWKNANEVNAADAEYNFYTHVKAVAAFGKALPTKEQLEELIDNCQWTWNGSGYMVTGPNGHSIVLPAAGYSSRYGNVRNVGSDGVYWSSTPSGFPGSDYARYLAFRSGEVGMGSSDPFYGYSVRLVKN